MTKERLLSSIWVRIGVFLWMIVFPIIFIAIPALEMVTGERAVGLMPAWAFLVWMLGPLVGAIGLKYFGGNRGETPSTAASEDN